MAQNITIMGASYSAVPAVTLPKTGGGTARFDDASVTTATASDVASGKIFLASDGTITTGTASGGGGASNVAIGTFKGTTAGSVLEVSTGHTGSGYPIAVMIWPEEGFSNGGTFYSLLQRYAIAFWAAFKTDPSTAPTHAASGSYEPNIAVSSVTYKNSTSNATTLARSGNIATPLYVNLDPSATSTGQLAVRFKADNNKMHVFIAGTSYGFAKDTTYKFCIVYSS